MAGLPWIKVWTRVVGHPKLPRLERELGIKDGLGIVVRLWCWTADFCPDGDIAEGDILEAVKVARGEATRRPVPEVLAALTSVGLLDYFPNGYRVHDWHEMQTVHVEAVEKRRAQGAERQRNWRARNAGVTQRNALRDASRNGDSVTEREKETEKKQETPPPTRVRAREASTGTEPPGSAGCPPAATPEPSPGPRGNGSEGSTSSLRRLSPLPTPETRTAELYPATTALLAALDAAGEHMSHASAARRGDVERLVVSVGPGTAARRLLAALKRHPDRKRFLGFWLDDLQREPLRAVGDLGCEAEPWYTRLTADEARAYRDERRAIAPDMDDAPIGITGPARECAALNDAWRARIEARQGGVA